MCNVPTVFLGISGPDEAPSRLQMRGCSAHKAGQENAGGKDTQVE